MSPFNRRPPAINAIPRDGNKPLWVLPAALEPAAERQHRKERLAAAFRLFGRYGFEAGLVGHFTARDPILTDHFWYNPMGVPFAHIRASDLLLVRPDGEVVEGSGLVNLSGVPYHDAFQQARPDIVGIAHAHSIHAKAWSAFHRVLDPITRRCRGVPRRSGRVRAAAARGCQRRRRSDNGGGPSRVRTGRA